MKQQALAIAAATMLTIGLGTANAYEQSSMPDQSASPDMSACSTDPGLCEGLINQENEGLLPTSEDGIMVGQQDESTNESVVEEQADDQNQAEDQDIGTAEQASDESSLPDVIIFVQ